MSDIIRNTILEHEVSQLAKRASRLIDTRDIAHPDHVDAIRDAAFALSECREADHGSARESVEALLPLMRKLVDALMAAPMRACNPPVAKA